MPFIVQWPAKVEPGSTSDQTVCLTDLIETAAQIANPTLPVDAGEDSVSFLPVLLGEDAAPLREATVHHSVVGTFAIRQDKWKFIGGPGPGPDQWDGLKEGDPPTKLYDLETDRHEDKNLVTEQPDRALELKKLLERYKEQ